MKKNVHKVEKGLDKKHGALRTFPDWMTKVFPPLGQLLSWIRLLFLVVGVRNDFKVVTCDVHRVVVIT